MRVVGLISGGKDSIYSLVECVRHGHEVVCLANLAPPGENDAAVDELDSFMFQTVGHRGVEFIAQATELPLVRRVTTGEAKSKSVAYTQQEGDEVEDLFQLLSDVKQRFPDVQAVASGAILSDYQRVRVENVCKRLGLVSLSFLWQRDQTELLNEMLESRMNVILVKTAVMGLEPRFHLGKSLLQLHALLMRLRDEYGMNVCGEGGEYETLTLDCPLYKKRIVVEASETVGNVDDPIAPVAHMRLVKLSLTDKTPEELADDRKALSLYAPEQGKSNKAEMWPVEAANENCSVRVESHQDACTMTVTATVAESNSANAARAMQMALDTLVALACERQLALNESAYYCAVQVSDMRAFRAVDAVYGAVMDTKMAPARMCVATDLTTSDGDGFAVRLAVSLVHHYHKNLHVRSISKWAPSCIGSYAQAALMTGYVPLAGQIGLLPGTMQLACDTRSQLMQCVDNCTAVADCLKADMKQPLCTTLFVHAECQHSDNEISDMLARRIATPFLLARVKALPRHADVELVPHLLLNALWKTFAELSLDFNERADSLEQLRGVPEHAFSFVKQVSQEDDLDAVEQAALERFRMSPDTVVVRTLYTTVPREVSPRWNSVSCRALALSHASEFTPVQSVVHLVAVDHAQVHTSAWLAQQHSVLSLKAPSH